MDALIVYPALYVLELADECFYIGISHNLNHRLSQHFNNKGSKWTKAHAPIRVVEVKYPATIQDENETTRIYIEKYGLDKVRGGTYTRY